MTESRELQRSNDKFSAYITDQERQQLLDCPIPLVIHAVADTLKLLDSETRQRVLTRVFQLAITGQVVPELIKNFMTDARGEQLNRIEPYIEEKPLDSHCLSILVGTAEGIKTSGKGAEFNTTIDKIKDEYFKNNPDKYKAEKAVSVLKTLLSRSTQD